MIIDLASVSVCVQEIADCSALKRTSQPQKNFEQKVNDFLQAFRPKQKWKLIKSLSRKPFLRICCSTSFRKRDN
ncbi:hypothetical protein BpHYR1_040293 [Brachionus plicatilis]|uniref:Uncharacterized protein n=1 Tax=Brachionus plicatilis TaxID=10195 RepID=A0A3M7PLL8_BRAPC|nr:hypothetical protein BpHYR1_040293 [Brachionus plicatilis]